MTYRGSLRQCVNMVAYQLKQGNHAELVIKANPAGKYYSVITLEELHSDIPGANWHQQRTVFHGTMRELMTIHTLGQTDLFTEESNGN